MSSLVIRTFPSDHVTPVRAYASLRARSAGRPSFLFEWGDRFAALGYRPHSEALYPNGQDTLATLREEAAALEATGAGDAVSAGDCAAMAAGICRGIVGFLAFEVLQEDLDVDPWGELGLLARFIREPTVVVFDQKARTMTIAGASDGAVRRCAWELAQDPGLSPLAPIDPDALPEVVDVAPEDDVFAGKAGLARARLSAGEAERLVLARTYRAPPRGADALDAYRALRVLLPEASLFFLDYTETPLAPAMTLFGASEVRMTREPRAEGAPEEAIEDLRRALLVEAPIGRPTQGAARISRMLETAPRVLYGGAAGYLMPGGAMAMTIGHTTATLMFGEITVVAGGEITSSKEAELGPPPDAKPMLAAIRAAQQVQRAREEAARKKAEAEKAAAEKAAAEKAAAEQAEAEPGATEEGRAGEDGEG